MYLFWLKPGALISILSALCACSSYSPDVSQRQHSALSIPKQWQRVTHSNTTQHLIKTSPNTGLSNQLLQLINDPQLEKLVEQTLLNNYDLQRTAIRVREQQLIAHQIYANRSPIIDLNLTSQREKNPQIYNQHQLSLNLSWEIDVWGRLADANTAAAKRTQIAELDYQAAQDSLVARVVQQWIDISVREQILMTENTWLASLKATEATITERYIDGLGNIADLDAAHATTERILARIVARQQTQHTAYQHLAMLQGSTDTTALPDANTQLNIAAPPSILPADLIAHRPDLKAAYHAITAADSEAAAAYKQLLPSFNLSSSLSQTRPHISDLLSGSTAWSLLTRLSAPVFNAGRIKSVAKVAELQAERSYLHYQQTLLTALTEVENALGQEAALAIQQQHYQNTFNHAESSSLYYQARYKAGLTDILDLLNAEQSAFEARIQLLQTQQARLTNRISLGLALGLGV